MRPNRNRACSFEPRGTSSKMQQLLWRPSPNSRSLFAWACLTAAVGCSSNYQPEGQFWRANGGPFSSASGTIGGESAVDSGGNGGAFGGSAGSPNGGSSEQLEAGAANGGSPESGGASPDGSGGGSLGGSPPSSGGMGGSAAGGRAGGSAAGGRAAGGSAAGGASASATCSLGVTVTTVAPGGNYRPRNVGAIWVATGSGQFIKSLEVWANQRISRVTAWNAATRAAGVAGNKVDAVSSATLSAHRTHNVTWNCRDYKGASVPDGSYRVYFEVTDSNNSGPTYFVAFNKGATPATAQGSATNFQNVSLTFKP